MKSSLLKMKLLLAVLLALVASSHARGAPRADCVWNVNTIPDPSPLYIKIGGGFDLNGFWLPQTGDQVTVPEGTAIIFACPGGTLSGPGGTEATLTCIGGSSWQSSSGSTYSFSSLTCSREPFHDARISATKTCNINVPNTDLMEIGFELANGDFYIIIETCFDTVNLDTLYTVHMQTPAIGGVQSGYPRPGWVQGPWYGNMDVDYQYSCTGQTEAFTIALGSASLVNTYVDCGSDEFISRGHTTAKSDFVYGVHQRATFWFLNVAPQWQTVNGANWNTLEINTRALADTYPNDLWVWTGTHGVTTLPDINGNDAELYIYYENGVTPKLRVPEFFWRVVYDPVSQRGTAFVGMNNPHISTVTPVCPDVCDQITWETWNANNQANGFGYCCEV
ncbi:hypothetical protein B566_EDAN016137, partial [Ephemera danica]